MTNTTTQKPHLILAKTTDESERETMMPVPGIDLKNAAMLVYAMSQPVGMGFLHATDGPLPPEDAEALVKAEGSLSHVLLDMDYVHGRCCKFTVFARRTRDGGEPTPLLPVYWYDHANEQYATLLTALGFPTTPDELADLQTQVNGQVFTPRGA